MFLYNNGEEIRKGDLVNVDDAREAVVTDLLSSSDPACAALEYSKGAVAISPNSLYEVPLGQEIQLIRRADQNKGDTAGSKKSAE